ncbi:AAA family ATPase [Anaerorhabdus sp.]|uniref:AAA family ATPase n=1 Tax=Anaerorhabdus sp. TaxID=1872524 RepID=UPI002FCC6DF8
MTSQKDTAYDYLLELLNDKKIDSWMKKVITTYLNNHGQVTEEEKECLISELLSGGGSPLELSAQYSTSNEDSTVTLKSLKHISGVNALADNQEIKFNNDVTVLYGLNGSGKSSYFRIIQAMTGNIPSEDIKQNIYLEKPNKIKVNLSYFLNGNQLDENDWNNTGAIAGLKPIRVFDSIYANSFLKKRESDDLLIQPYHLGIFAEIIALFDELKENAIQKLEEQLKGVQQPQKEQLSNEVQTILDKESFLDEDSSFFAQIFNTYNDESEAELSLLETEYKTLLETNFNDKKQLNNTTIQEYKRVQDVYLTYIEKWLAYSVEYHEIYEKKKEYEKLSAQRKSTLTVLSKIPGTDSDIWKRFIKSANEYVEENSIDECPYCHRTYDDKSLLFVNAYAEFLNDNVEEQLTKTNSKIQSISNDNDISQILNELTSTEHISEEVKKDVILWLGEISKFREDLKTAITNNLDLSALDISLTVVKNRITQLSSGLVQKNNEYIESEVKKTENLAKIDEQLSGARCKKSIHEQYVIIKSYMETKNEIKSKYDTVVKLTTNKISKASNAAHKELLSDQLQEHFADNLVSLGLKGKKIELMGKNNKGTQQTELLMKSHKDVTAILSEGEQKVASVALFIAEIEVSKNKSVIILDDPVTSLDHKMMAQFTDMILQLQNQVIILTHNRMFMDLINGSEYGHFCKTFDTDCNKAKGKHIYVYQTTSEGNNNKGVIIRRINVCAKDYLQEIDTLLSKSPFNDVDSVCAKMRKTVDCLIDEILFNGQIPRKYSIKGTGQSINWAELKKIGKSAEVVDSLREIFDRTSAGDLHIGQISRQNPPEKEELVELYNKLSTLSQNSIS